MKMRYISEEAVGGTSFHKKLFRRFQYIAFIRNEFECVGVMSVVWCGVV